ncbi:hypothetical protein [Plastoroseomonas hellenica]|uniref:hypothetical protein n=1 Tax=Plastoroseomonas hellenica TaxID=2687306 RepID=UPI001BA938EE|nr:hypothetical protein [Plastoroseomonas hellenica]MBR0644502.1 hypothetical protein [Plastoroseomonas hellenica]
MDILPGQSPAVAIRPGAERACEAPAALPSAGMHSPIPPFAHTVLEMNMPDKLRQRS